MNVNSLMSILIKIKKKINNVGNEDVIVAFLRKEPLIRNKIRSNGNKLFFNNCCIGQWDTHKVIMNDTKYNDPEITKMQTALFKWLQNSDIIFRSVVGIPYGVTQILSYYERCSQNI